MSEKIKWNEMSKGEKKEFLKEHYLELKWSQDKIANVIGINQTSVSKRLRRFGIPCRKDGEGNKGVHKWGGTRKCPWISKSNVEKPRTKQHRTVCVVCGKEIHAPNCRKRKCCSIECRGKLQSQLFKGRKVPWIHKATQTMILNKSSYVLKHNKDADFRKKILKGLIKRPNNTEKYIINIIHKHNLPFKYVGDGELIIGGLNPDFVHISDKKVIEVFGRVYHDKSKSYFDVAYNRTEDGRIECFNKFGYKCLVIWDDELTNEERVLYNIKQFLNLGKIEEQRSDKTT
jgi:very-short-patch-repair endonuclease